MSSERDNVRRSFPLLEFSPEEQETFREFLENLNIDSDNDLDAIQYEDESDFDDSVEDPDFVPPIDPTSESESGNEEQEGEVVAIEPERGQKYTGQGKGDKTVWWSVPSAIQKDRAEKMKKKRLDSFPFCKENFDDKQNTFKRIFPPSIVGQIVLETNRKAKRTFDDNRRSNPSKRMRKWRDTNVDEIYAYIAILIHAGAEKSNNVEATDLFSKKNMAFYRAIMSLLRFEQLSRFIRFDDSRTRIVRLRQDKLAPIRYIWDLFQKNLTLAFVPSLELVIDEQLLTTRNRCSFKQYIPSKPGKYGIKIFWMVDSKTNYPLSAEIYLGQQPNENRSTGVAHDLVLRLAKNYLNIGANITMDNFFTSYTLAEDLIAKDTTIVGTMRSNKRELPKTFASAADAKNRGENSAIFCFSNSCQLTSYTTNTNKNVLLLSTAHVTEEMHPDTGKPLIIHDYNEHKGGVDTFNKMLRGFTCKRKCCRWPMLIFFNMLDVAALAAYRLFELSNPTWKANAHDKRKIFLKELSYNLAQNELEKRSKIPNLSKSTKIAMDLIDFKPKQAPAVRREMPYIQVNNT